MTTLLARRRALIEADNALAANERLDLAMGTDYETPDFRQLNRAVNDALAALPWWARVAWGGDWRWFLAHPRDWNAAPRPDIWLDRFRWWHLAIAFTLYLLVAIAVLAIQGVGRG